MICLFCPFLLSSFFFNEVFSVPFALNNPLRLKRCLKFIGVKWIKWCTYICRRSKICSLNVLSNKFLRFFCFLFYLLLFFSSWDYFSDNRLFSIRKIPKTKRIQRLKTSFGKINESYLHSIIMRCLCRWISRLIIKEHFEKKSLKWRLGNA